ncbi:hypothetical protein [Scytonema millei]|uniref:Uncharacterized protein n=1 Tax=Scytonema millei VB511283 TaxID=1245923 RepID=A0A9X5E8T1_9CYAN|nr:hypothetical protein [Scytonema millei]NHC37342.1 hypothetical protein [Scytonema millei VB511283]
MLNSPKFYLNCIDSNALLLSDPYNDSSDSYELRVYPAHHTQGACPLDAVSSRRYAMVMERRIADSSAVVVV